MSGCGIKNTVIIVTHRHGVPFWQVKFRRGAGCPFQRAALLGRRYYQGNRSPNEIERREKGYSAAWLHHKGRNRHHLEYWIDYAADGSGMCGMKLPLKYVLEMFCDRVAASKTYRGAVYRDSDPYDYYARSIDHYIIHPDTAKTLEYLLRTLRDEGEDKAFQEARRMLREEKHKR